MTFDEAIALQPVWVGIWLNILLLGAFILPLALLFWRQSRRAGLLTIAASLLGGFSVMMLYDAMGYVKLLGLPHIIFWTPTAYYLFTRIRAPGMPKIPRWIMAAVLAIITISLVFDYVDVIRYALGERTPLAGSV